MEAHKNWTAKDLPALAEVKAYTKREILDGELVVSPSPSHNHAGKVWFLSKELMLALDLLRDQPLAIIRWAPLDVVLGPKVVVQPDVLLIKPGGKARFGPYAIHGPPDLVMEVVSPGSRQLDTVRKRRLYARGGVPEYWIVDPEQESIEVLVLDGRKYRSAGWYGPGERAKSVGFPFEVAVDEVFAQPDRIIVVRPRAPKKRRR